MKFPRFVSLALLFSGLIHLASVSASPHTNRTITGPIFSRVSPGLERIDFLVESVGLPVNGTKLNLSLAEMHRILVLLRRSLERVTEPTIWQEDSSLRKMRNALVNAQIEKWTSKALMRGNFDRSTRIEHRVTKHWIFMRQTELDIVIRKAQGWAEKDVVDALIKQWNLVADMIKVNQNRYRNDEEILVELAALDMRVASVVQIWRGLSNEMSDSLPSEWSVEEQVADVDIAEEHKGSEKSTLAIPSLSKPGSIEASSKEGVNSPLPSLERMGSRHLSRDRWSIDLSAEESSRPSSQRDRFTINLSNHGRGSIDLSSKGRRTDSTKEKEDPNRYSPLTISSRFSSLDARERTARKGLWRIIKDFLAKRRAKVHTV